MKSQEIHRLANILTELDYSAHLEQSFGNMATMNKVDAIFDKDIVLKKPYEFYVEAFAEIGIYSFADCDSLDNWLICNIGKLVEYYHPQIFREYGAVSISINIHYKSFRYFTTVHYLGEKFGKELAKIRKDKNRKQTDLGINRTQVCLIENNLANPTLDNLLIIARSLGVNLKLV